MIVFVTFLAGGATMYGIYNFLPAKTAVVNKGGGTDVTIQNEGSINSSIQQIYDAVVVVKALSNGKDISSGTGFVYKTEGNKGYIMTNKHVVDNATEVQVILSNNETVTAKVEGGDVYADIAVLTIDANKVLKVATIGNSDKVALGDTVFTVGSPLGSEYSGTVTKGVLSGKDRLVTVSVSGNSSDWVMKLLQTDAAINPGNSGGPLVDINGQVIGVNSLKFADQSVEGMGFAIPINDAMTYAETLEKGDSIKRPVLGISLVDVNEVSNYRYGFATSSTEELPQGVIVGSVEGGSSAEKAGLQQGDIITKLDGKETTSKAYLRYELYQHKEGDTVELTYLRDGKEQTTKVKLS